MFHYRHNVLNYLGATLDPTELIIILSVGYVLCYLLKSWSQGFQVRSVDLYQLNYLHHNPMRKDLANKETGLRNQSKVGGAGGDE